MVFNGETLERNTEESVRVPFFVTLRPKDPGPNKWFGEPGLDSPQLTGCLRVK